MNKTLLLIIIDFLFLNLIALTRWEKAEPVRSQLPPVPQVAANAAISRDQDLVETMREALVDERGARDALERRLGDAGQALAARERSLAQLQEERTRMAGRLTEAQAAAGQLAQQVAAAKQEATLTHDEIAQLERELDERNAEAERQRQAVAVLERQQASARKEIEGLTMAVVVGEAEKQHLQEKATQLQAQVQAERAERIKVQEQTTQLAQGVGQLAQKSGELTQELRSNRPVNINVLFGDYLANRVKAGFTTSRRGFFGQVEKTNGAYAVLTSDGTRVYALLHVDDTTFSFGPEADDWERFSIGLDRPPDAHASASELRFLGADPRVVAIFVDADQAAALGAKVYPLAADPFKFPNAVLMDGRGLGYGEVAFKVDASHPGYVRVENRFFKRLFGDFAPSAGDLVFSHTGELLGIMVNSDYCALVKDFSAAATIKAGPSIAAQATGRTLDGLGARVQGMPEALR
jgi:hypothetical protein